MKNYYQSPLPFQGQKRRFLNKFEAALNLFPNSATYIDLFGGSGLLSHNIKIIKPKARVIWNDFDDYRKRLNHIHNTNQVLKALRDMLKDYGKKAKIINEDRLRVLDLLRNFESAYGYLDYITISSNLLFSSKYATNIEEMDEAMYNKVRIADYHCEGYLEGVERISTDYKLAFSSYNSSGVVWVVDPPYLSTDTSSYSNCDYWKLRDYLDVLLVLEHSNYFYFTSNKSQIVELCQWMETKTNFSNPFFEATMDTTVGTLNYNSTYTDIMIYKNKK